MGEIDTLKAHLDAAWTLITESDLYRSEAIQATKDAYSGKPYSETWRRLDPLTYHLFETAALLADDDIQEMTATIANEKGRKMNAEDLAKAMYLDKLAGVYQLPDEPAGPLWDKAGSKWVRVKENLWYGGINGVYWVWGDVVHYYGPLTTTPPTPPIKEGDTGLTAEQVWDLPKGTVIWPERDAVPEPWLRLADGCGWESLSDEAFDAGSLQCVCGDGFTVLRLGGGE